MVEAPTARFDKPVGSRVKAVDEKQEHGPDEKVPERYEHRRHDEVAAGEARRRDRSRYRQRIESRGVFHGWLEVPAVPLGPTVPDVGDAGPATRTFGTIETFGTCPVYFCLDSQMLNAHFCISSCFSPMAGSASGKAYSLPKPRL